MKNLIFFIIWIVGTLNMIGAIICAETHNRWQYPDVLVFVVGGFVAFFAKEITLFIIKTFYQNEN